jgi:hypothetical protein
MCIAGTDGEVRRSLQDTAVFTQVPWGFESSPDGCPEVKACLLTIVLWVM